MRRSPCTMPIKTVNGRISPGSYTLERLRLALHWREVYRRTAKVMTNRPWARRSRWMIGRLRCAPARWELAALLGRGHDATGGRPRRRGALAAHRPGKLRRPPRQRHHRPRTLPARAARRPPVEPDPRPVPRRDRRRPQLLLRERHRRIREVPLRTRRCDQGGRRGAGLRDLPPLPAAQPRAHELRARTAHQEAGFRHR